MNDYEINKKANLKNITEIAAMIGLKEDDIELYGKYIAKINNQKLKKKKGKLILVTATNPTPLGEGKTTLSIGLCDALNANGYQSMLALREPSLGPVFGLKGGATGGGASQIAPMEKINLHFTGDFHAITAANNLISAVIDNHIHFGNELNIEKVVFTRCLDVNDRALRNIKLENRVENFTITAASEIMTTFCLATSLEDLKTRIGNILVGYTSSNEEIYVRDLHCEEAATALLKDALKPNLVQTLNHSPALVHGGPFANIAHGCNSVIATNLALSLSDYVITEAGFGSDMGALKFLDIKCGTNDFYPDLIIVNSTIRSLKYNGNNNLEQGIKNLEYHITNMKKFNDNVLVILNKFKEDKEEEIEFVKQFCNRLNTEIQVSNMYFDGTKNTKELTEKVVELANQPNTKGCNIYNKEDDIITKITKYCKELFYAKEVVFEEIAKKQIENLKDEYNDYKICISKTPASITDNPNILGFPKDHTMTVTSIKINRGGKFITVLMGNILTMPGLGKQSNYLNIKIKDNEILGIN